MMKLTLAVLILLISHAACSVQQIPLQLAITSNVSEVYEESLEAPGQNSTAFTLSGTISLGTPAQNFTVLFSTASSDFWIAQQSLVGRNTFNSSASTTFSQTSGSLLDCSPSCNPEDSDSLLIEGSLGVDTLAISGATIENVFFGLATQINGFPEGVDGLLGLAFSQVDFNSEMSSLEDILRQGEFDTVSFSIFVSENSSSLFLGGVNPSYAKTDFQYLPVIGNGMWSFLGQITVGSVPISNNIEIMVDTTASQVIGLPLHIYFNFFALTGIQKNGSWQPDILDVLHPIQIEIGNITLTIPPSAYMVQNDMGLYELAIRPQAESPTMVILGANFLELYYTHFDYENERIGFAEPADI